MAQWVRVSAAQAWEPEFGSPAPLEMLDMAACVLLTPEMGRREGGGD